jgi:N6-adenosine-specific RNA methylase IME4
MTPRYRTIVADPPWAYRSKPQTGKANRLAAASDFYPTMTVAEIAALPVADLAEPDAHLYVWTTNQHMIEAHEVVSAWGFDYKTMLTWDKTGPLGLGRWFRGRTEHVLFAVRGSLPIEARERHQNIFHATNHAHSVKPDVFFDIVEAVSPGPYLELFARRQRLGWDTWGNEALGHVDLAERAVG